MSSAQLSALPFADTPDLTKGGERLTWQPLHNVVVLWEARRWGGWWIAPHSTAQCTTRLHFLPDRRLGE